MAITQAICNSFKKQLLEADMNFKQTGGDKFKLALYSSTATLNSATTAYPGDSTGGQVGNTGQYTQGGGLLVNNGTSISAGVARCDFADRSFTGVTLTARGALIYNTSSDTTNASVCVLDFGADKTATSGTFTIQFPAPTSTAAILRISG
jgi:hypothetical protein|tara:strand:+ start:436 stop:885 length:450 start_codon:yes stop_codon:yes gene_type:complete